MAWMVLVVVIGTGVLFIALVRGRRHPGRIALVALLLVFVVGALWWNRPGEPVDLERVESVDGRTFDVGYLTGECEQQSRVEVDEGPDEVVVTVRERTVAMSCSDVGVQGVATVRLDEPLGDRRVVDGFDGRELSAG